MSRRRRKRKRTGKQGGGPDKAMPPTPLGPNAVPDGSSDADGEAATVTPESAEKLVEFTHTRSFEFSGPLPHPEFFQAYDDTLPGAAHRILTMAEKQQEYRHSQQSVRLASDASRETRGQWMAFAIVLVALIGSMTLIAFDKTVEGITTALGAIVGIVGVFISSKRAGSRDSPPDPPPLPQSPARPPTIAD